MPVLTNGLYRVDFKQTYFGQQCINTFWYRNIGDSNIVASDLAVGFDNQIVPVYAPIQTSGVSYDEIQVTPVFDNQIDFVRVPTITNGTHVGSPVATFMAASIKLNRSTREVRNGWKRITGLVEQGIDGTGFAPGYFSDLESLATAFELNVTNGPEVFEPYIVRKPFSTKAQSSDWVGVEIDSAVALNRSTSQNTRKL